MIDQATSFFLDFPIGEKIIVQAIQNPVDKLGAFWCGIGFRQFQILVNSHLNRNLFKIQHFADGHVHQDPIQSGDTLQFPVFSFFDDQLIVPVAIFDGFVIESYQQAGIAC